MKKILLLAMTVSSLLTFYSCKTTEANYKAAYDLATKNKQVNDSIDDTVIANNNIFFISFLFLILLLPNPLYSRHQASGEPVSALSANRNIRQLPD